MPTIRFPRALASAQDSLFDKIYREERYRLERYLGRKAGPDVCADLVQDVFVKALASDHAKELVNPAGFLWRIARNLAIDTQRRKARYGDAVEFDEAQHGQAAEQDQVVEGAELRALYETALTALPQRTQDIFVMHRVHDLSYRQISEQVGITVAGVEYHMSRAILHLARTLDIAR